MIFTTLSAMLLDTTLFTIFFFIINGGSAAPVSDLVTSLPGANFTIDFKHYSGYLKASPTKYFHYWFTETANNPESAPIILWLNGGPGCSSLVGLLTENGPFHISDYGNTIYRNPWAWNRAGNVIYLESPAGIGFSYDTTGNMSSSDEETAQLNHNALVDFFNHFPEYRNNDFFISGESYGGVYVPTLAVKIVEDKINFPKFKGFAIGNGIYSWPLQSNTLVPFLYYHGIIRQSLYDDVRTNCCDGNIESCDFYSIDKENSSCGALVHKILNQHLDLQLDIYNLYNTCYLEKPSGTKHFNFLRRAILSKTISRKFDSLESKSPSLPLCAQSDDTEIYLNRDDVRDALHIPSSVGKWTECNSIIPSIYKYQHTDVKFEFEKLIASNVRSLTYNGDADTLCNFVHNKQFLANLNLTVEGNKFESVAWTYANEIIDVAGFWTPYSKNVDFLTVRGAGHFVPMNKPREALQMIYNFVHQRNYSEPIPSNV